MTVLVTVDDDDDIDDSFRAVAVDDGWILLDKNDNGMDVSSEDTGGDVVRFG
jgi:hypothetical protein